MNVPPETPELTAADDWRGAGQRRRLGIFDSGLGGLSVLKSVRRWLPDAGVCYVADSGHAPYGDRDDAFVVARSEAVAHFLVDEGVDALVVACNTATAAAVHHLRRRWPDVPVIGVEPGVKPAVQRSHNKRVGVLATPVTLASDKFRALVSRFEHEATLVLQPCPGLAREIERGLLDSPALRHLVHGFTHALRQAGVDTVVLGCTHYPLIAPLFQDALGTEVTLIDTSDAVARHVHSTLQGLPPSRMHANASFCDEPVSTALWTSGQPEDLRRAAADWLGLDTEVRALAP